VTVGADTYEPIYIEDDGTSDPTEMAKKEVKIKLPRDNEVADIFRGYPPGEVVNVFIYHMHTTDTDAEVVVVWFGRILGGKEERDSRSTLTCEPMTTSVKRTGLRRKFTRNCGLVLYGLGNGKCNVDKEAYRVIGVISGVNGTTLTVTNADAYADGHFDGGFIEWSSTQKILKDSRMIRSHIGATIEIVAQIPGINIGDQVYLFPGCDRTDTTCQSKFLNELNFGGIGKNIPRINPFGGASIF
jgi:uncharacterized phage protein (TIGR02218 family)